MENNRTDKFVTRLETLEEKTFPLRYYDIMDMILAYKKLNEYDEKINFHLNALEGIIDKTMKETRTAREERLNFWETLLYDFYYIKVFDKEEKNKILYEFYFFPYKVVRTNSMVFGLYSEKKDCDKYYLSQGGITEASLHIFKDLSTHPLEIEYSSEEEMMNNAMESCKKLIDIRMWKLKYRDKLI